MQIRLAARRRSIADLNVRFVSPSAPGSSAKTAGGAYLGLG
jgi:hypothetical protein